MNESIPQQPILVLILIVVGVVALWLLYRAVLPLLAGLRTVRNLWLKILIAAGFVMLALFWFLGSLFGVVAGGFVAVTGAILSLRK